MKVWLLTEDRAYEHAQVGLYSSLDAARRALSALGGEAPIDWLEGGGDSVTLAFVRMGDGVVRAFQVYPLEVDQDPAGNESAERETDEGRQEHGEASDDAGVVPERALQPVAS